MAHNLLLKLPFARKGSLPTVPITPSLGNAVDPSPQEPSASPTVNSNLPLPLIVIPPPGFRSAQSRPRRPLKLLKKLLGRHAPSNATASKRGQDKALTELRLGSHAGAEPRDGNCSPGLDTPKSGYRLHWDCAKTVYRRSAEPRSPVFSNEGLAFFEILSPTDKVTPIDGWPAYPSIGEPRTEEPPSPRQSLNLKNDTNPPPGTLAYTTCSSSPSEYSVENISDAREHDTSKATGSRNQAEEPNRPVPKFSPPNVGTEMRRASLMLRPVSSGGPAPQVLSPPPVKAVVPVRRPVRRVVTVPRLLPPTPSPRIRSRPSTAHNASGPMSPASVIPEEKLIQLQVRTPQVESNAPLGYRRSFTHVQGLRARALPTPPLPRVHHFRPLPPLPIASPPNP